MRELYIKSVNGRIIPELKAQGVRIVQTKRAQDGLYLFVRTETEINLPEDTEILTDDEGAAVLGGLG